MKKFQIINGVKCCPLCGSIDIRFRKQTLDYVCNRLYCGLEFICPTVISDENFEEVMELRKRYAKNYPF